MQLAVAFAHAMSPVAGGLADAVGNPVLKEENMVRAIFTA